MAVFAIGVLCPASLAAAKSPKLRTATAFGSSGQLTVTGSIAGKVPKRFGGHSKWRALLEQRAGRRWIVRARSKVRGKRRTFRLVWRKPPANATVTVRVRVVRGSRQVVKGPVQRLRVRSRPAPPPEPLPSPGEVSVDLPPATDATPHLPADAITAEASSSVDAAGGLVVLPGVAELSVRPGAVEQGEIRLAAVDSPASESLRAKALPAFTSLGLPHVRVESSQPLGEPVELKVFLPHSQALPGDRAPAFAATFPAGDDERDAGGTGPFEGRMTADFASIGGRLCSGGEALCVTLLPAWFATYASSNSFQLGRAFGAATGSRLTVAPGTIAPSAGTRYHLWRASVSDPADETLTVAPGQSVPITGRFRLDDSNIAFDSRAPLMVNSLRSHFWYNDGEFHGASDLHAQVGTQVRAPLGGHVETLGWGATSNIGNFIWLRHGNLKTIYGHLGTDEANPTFAPGLTFGTPVMPGDLIALSGNSTPPGGLVPHLHFAMELDARKVDPQPVLQHDRSLYYKPARTYNGSMVAPDGDPIVLEVIADGVQSATQAPWGRMTVDSIDDPIEFSVEIPPDITLPSTDRFTLTLQMRSARLGGAHTLKTWQVGLTRPTLTVVKTGGGSGTVTSVAPPGGISCGTDCEEQYAPGSTVTLSADPDPDSRFIEWGGACTGTARVTTVTLAADARCEARFEPPAVADLVLSPITPDILDYHDGCRCRFDIRFFTSITNSGPDTVDDYSIHLSSNLLANLFLQDGIPGGFIRYPDGTPACAVQFKVDLHCDVALALEPGATVYVIGAMLSVRVPPCPATQSVTISIASSAEDPNPANNERTSSTNVCVAR